MGDQNNHDRNNCEQCLRDDLETANERIAELTEQRDELLAALKRIAYAQFSLESPPIKSVAEILQGFAIEAIAKAEKK